MTRKKRRVQTALSDAHELRAATFLATPRTWPCFGWMSVKDEATAKTLRSLSGLGLILLLLELRAVDVAEYVRRFEDSEHDVACLEGC